jgi:hypothetical protein
VAEPSRHASLLHRRKRAQRVLDLAQIRDGLDGKSTGRLNFSKSASFCTAVPCISRNSVSKIFFRGFASCLVDSRFVFQGSSRELAFLRHPFKRLTASLDPVLKLAAVRGKKADYLIPSTYRRQGKSTLVKINDLPDFKLVPRHVCLPDLLVATAV